ncbi:TonB-linked SusC/RagA family outer membrane protein [Anseongella ginsenosidimutans]|uniref:TonB-linked SusC/RagA family outer membrane protein n=2 Tax=Anseongella ginsenosidimutans TaxID=496056 RepID=A0A4R3KZ85_9SPHI|nr:TonB-dependent receptor [Anseongella ginsenosidimutans]TCS89930.1 TonB-linked SusC/RagA family outer membrane protein [Anseongella ginsenosidimutans]
MRKFMAILLAIVVMSQGKVFPQDGGPGEHAVSGKVTAAADGSPMPGVSVLLKGTINGISTDLEGNYTISAAPNDVLVFSFLGYESQEVIVGSQRTIDVSLTEDVANLDEVVVVGYGQMKRADISGAQVSVTAEDIGKTLNTTIGQALQGRAAGVYVTQNSGQPGGGISVNIRGINSINGSNEPLYVIDGVQIAPGTVAYGATSSMNPLAGLNPTDIASMEVLQGPSATAIYGSRGTNGVVLITTKRGEAGQMKINYNFLYSVQDEPEMLSVMSLRQYAQMVNEYHAIAGGDSPGAFLDPSVLGEGTNWQDALFKTSPLQKHQLSLSGGSERTTFYLSGEYFDQEGVAIGSSFKRYSLRLNVDNQTRDWLKLSANLSLNQTDDQLGTSQENVINNAINIAPNVPVRNPDGSWGGPDAANGSSEQFTPLNPVAVASFIRNDLNRRGAMGGISADISILKGLTFRTSLNGEVRYSNSSYFIPTYQLGDRPNEVASLAVNRGTNIYWNLNQLAQYNTSIGKHEIGIMASHESQESSWENLSGSRTGFVTNEIPDLNIGSPDGAINGGGRGDWAMESYLGRLNYSYDGRYILQAAIRADGSSNFGPENRWGVFPSVSAAWRISQESFMQDVTYIEELKLRLETGLTGNQGSEGVFSPLNSVATPWGAGFLAGRYGNQELKWEETQTYNIGFNLSILENRVQLEGDFYIKKTDNLLMPNPLPDYMGTAGQGSIAPPIVNVGSLENRGYGFTLNTINIDRKGFQWNSNFNISGFRPKLTKLYSETAFLQRSAWYLNNWTQRSDIGKAPWLFYGYVYDGLFQSLEEIEASALPTDNTGAELAANPNSVWVGDIRYKDLNDDGVIDERDQTFIGNPWPDFSFGFSNSFSYKGFDLSILLTGTYGNDVFNYLRFVNTNPNNINLGRNLLEETFAYARIGTGDNGAPRLLNPETSVPRVSGSDVNGNGARFTDKFVEDGSYIRIKNIQLGYNLPESFLGRQPVIQAARLSVGVQNLATFTRYKGYDPEIGSFVGRDVAADTQPTGLDYGRYPSTPIYTFSVGLDF